MEDLDFYLIVDSTTDLAGYCCNESLKTPLLNCACAETLRDVLLEQFDLHFTLLLHKFKES